MRIPHVAAAAVTGLLFLSACPKKAVPPPPPRPPAVQVPQGCEEPLSGTWAHAERPDWRYHAADDGGTLVLDVERARAADPDGEVAGADGGVRPARDVTIELARTPDGFIGAARATVHTPSRPCRVAFPTRVTSCADGGLVLESSETLVVDEATCALVRDAPAQTRTHGLVRVPSDVPPAQAPDAG